ncbi:MAG: hypothetical protein K0A98_13265 [Trueperaceae bacterium]|nr:hypothetical protein [Trueperaceae bacterium]
MTARIGRATMADVPAVRATNSGDPWRQARVVGHQLGAWALASLAAGALLLVVAGGAAGAAAATLRALAVQCIAWGAIDGGIAAFGERDRRRRIARGEADDAGATAAFGARLRRLLRINAGLDVVYLLVGATLLLAWRTPEGLGHGLGVLIQGGFLLGLDAWHGWGPWSGTSRAGAGDTRG